MLMMRSLCCRMLKRYPSDRLPSKKSGCSAPIEAALRTSDLMGSKRCWMFSMASTLNRLISSSALSRAIFSFEM